MQIDIILNEFASPTEAADLGLLAEGYGIRGVWSSNYGWSRDPFMALSLLANQSSRVRMGPMAVSPAELHPLKMANLLLTLNEMCHGRAMIMVGGGGAVLQAIGKEREHMIGQVRECIDVLKSAAPGKTLNYKGKYFTVYGFRPDYATDQPPLIYFGSNHPQSRRMSAEIADGLITSDFCVPLMQQFITDCHAELSEFGRSPADFRISNFWAWHIKQDAVESYREARRELILRGYLGEQYFEPFLDPDEIALMRSHFKEFMDAFMNRSGVIENVPDELVRKMIDNISFVGGLEAIDSAVETLQSFASVGLTEIALRVHDDPADAIRLIGERVLPALQ